MKSKQKPKAIIAVSGGMDSCLTSSIAAEDYELAFIHFNYGQRTEARELKSFSDLASFFGVQHKLVVDFTHFHKIGGSSLTDRKISISKANLLSKEIPTSYVPFRNANILSACVSWAEVINAEAIFIGVVYEDSSGYPDCKPEFYNIFQRLIEIGTKPETNIKINTPIINYTKAEIVLKGMQLNSPFHLTWSCYKNDDIACGICDSCALRLRGFQQAGVIDQIPYVKKPKYI